MTRMNTRYFYFLTLLNISNYLKPHRKCCHLFCFSSLLLIFLISFPFSLCFHYKLNWFEVAHIFNIHYSSWVYWKYSVNKCLCKNHYMTSNLLKKQKHTTSNSELQGICNSLHLYKNCILNILNYLWNVVP